MFKNNYWCLYGRTEFNGAMRDKNVATTVQNLTTFEELQLVRRQIAKLNHRLMAVELENQQQQQREMIFTVLVTAYFFGKFIFWVNRNT